MRNFAEMESDVYFSFENREYRIPKSFVPKIKSFVKKYHKRVKNHKQFCRTVDTYVKYLLIMRSRSSVLKKVETWLIFQRYLLILKLFYIFGIDVK